MKTLPSGVKLTNFSLAVNRRWLNRSTNEWEEQTSFFDVTCWRELGENVAQSLTKGNRVMVSGHLEQRSWDNEQGEKRSKVEIVAEEVGPSLRWATTDVHRTERTNNFEASPSGNAPQPAMASAGFVNEEPF